MLQRMLAVVMVAIILMGGVGAIRGQYQDTVEESVDATTHTEAVTVNTSAPVELNESHRDVVYNTTDEITVEQNGTVYAADGNWSWNDANGTISFPTGTSLTEGDDANVSYGYHVPENSQQLARDVTLLPQTVLGGDMVFLLGLFMFMATFVVLMRVGGM